VEGGEQRGGLAGEADVWHGKVRWESDIALRRPIDHGGGARGCGGVRGVRELKMRFEIWSCGEDVGRLGGWLVLLSLHAEGDDGARSGGRLRHTGAQKREFRLVFNTERMHFGLCHRS
jgi:hypothetical protein